MQLTLSRKEIERICIDRFKLLEEVASTGATVSCLWRDWLDLEITIEPYSYSKDKTPVSVAGVEK